MTGGISHNHGPLGIPQSEWTPNELVIIPLATSEEKKVAELSTLQLKKINYSDNLCSKHARHDMLQVAHTFVTFWL